MNTVRSGALVVTAVVVVNAVGEPGGDAVVDEVGQGRLDPPPSWAEPFTNTTLGCVVTNARLDKVGCHLAAQGGHDGLARALLPVHTRMDGDAVVVAATQQVEAGIDEVRLGVTVAVERAVGAAVAGGVGTIES